jgi:hypothetical protein
MVTVVTGWQWDCGESQIITWCRLWTVAKIGKSEHCADLGIGLVTFIHDSSFHHTFAEGTTTANTRIFVPANKRQYTRRNTSEPDLSIGLNPHPHHHSKHKRKPNQQSSNRKIVKCHFVVIVTAYRRGDQKQGTASQHKS